MRLGWGGGCRDGRGTGNGDKQTTRYAREEERKRRADARRIIKGRTGGERRKEEKKERRKERKKERKGVSLSLPLPLLFSSLLLFSSFLSFFPAVFLPSFLPSFQTERQLFITRAAHSGMSISGGSTRSNVRPACGGETNIIKWREGEGEGGKGRGGEGRGVDDIY